MKCGTYVMLCNHTLCRTIPNVTFEVRNKDLQRSKDVLTFLFLNRTAFLITKMAQLGSTDLWIGLNSLNNDGFFWSDGKARKYTNWGISVSTQKHLDTMDQTVRCIVTSLLCWLGSCVNGLYLSGRRLISVSYKKKT